MRVLRNTKEASIKRKTAARLRSTRTDTRRMGRRNGTKNALTSSRGQTKTGQNDRGLIISRPTGRDTCARQTGTNNTPIREMFGRAIAHRIGSVNIILGANAAVTGATAFLKVASVRILAVDTGFAFTASHSLSWVD